MFDSSQRRPESARLASLRQPKSDEGCISAEFMAATLAASPGNTKVSCTVDQYCRTRIFDFPNAEAKESVPHRVLFQSEDGEVKASLVSDLESYFAQSNSRHYAISPLLPCEVKTKAEIWARQSATRENIFGLYLVIEEDNKVEPVVLEQCVSVLVGKVDCTDGKAVFTQPLEGDNAQAIMAIQNKDNWPPIPNNELLVNMILAAVRAAQDEYEEIPKRIDQSCLVTEDGQYASIHPSGRMSARLSASMQLCADEFNAKANELETAISRVQDDLKWNRVQLLVHALYWDDYKKDDNFKRLHYLSLWQALSECRKTLGYMVPPNVKLNNDKTIVAGSRSLAELTCYRNKIAHWPTRWLDESYLADIYRTINELLRRKYFRESPQKRET